MKTMLLVIALFVVACAPEGEQSRPEALSFSLQSPEAWDLFEQAADRIEAPSGVHAFSGLAGTTVHVLPRPDGYKDVCADTSVDFIARTNTALNISIALFVPAPEGCWPDPSLTLAHEMVHAIRGWSGLGLQSGNADHSTDGIFRANAGDARFEETSLEKLCEAVTCAQFSIEE